MDAVDGWLRRVRQGHGLPEFAHVPRSLPLGEHPYLAILPGAAHSPALARIAADAAARAALLAAAVVRVSALPGYAFIDVKRPCIVLSWSYYKLGAARDLYLDLLHELTHLRQLSEGAELWDKRFAYVDRPTEVEGYAVAVEEGRRLGMTPGEIVQHLSNPWMTGADVRRLLGHIDAFLARRAAG